MISIKKMRLITFILLIFVFLIPIATSASFIQDPVILNAQERYTFHDLICTWESENAVTTDVFWYRNGALVSSDLGTSSSSSTISSAETSKNEVWVCSVSIENGSSETLNSSVEVRNSPPESPILRNSSNHEIPEFFELIEDMPYTFFIESEDADNDPLTYLLDTNDLCTVVDSSTGEISCMATHELLTNPPASDPAPEEITNYTIWLNARDTGFPIFTTSNSFTFTLIPVNDQAYFIGNYTNVSINSDEIWSLELVGEDEELDLPLNFSVGGDLPSSALNINHTADTTADLYFDTITGFPGNDLVGTWEVIINVTDSFGANSTRPASSISFFLEINSTNFPPEFTTNLSDSPVVEQYEQFTFDITAFDPDVDDNLSMSIRRASSSPSYCVDNFPWELEIIDDSHNATFRINQTLNISHVICRDVILDLTDGINTVSSSEITLNVINVNDPPEIHEIGVNGNISNLSAVMYSNFEYLINATDPDELTYNADEFANLTYYINDSRFDIDPFTGLITKYLENESLVGEILINVTVSDGLLNDSRILNLTVLENSPPELNLLDNFNIYLQNESIIVNIQASDDDGDLMFLEFESLTDFNDSIYSFENTTWLDGSTRFTNFTLNMTKSNFIQANSQVGYHLLNITIFDENLATSNLSQGVLNFTINNTNDPPFFINPPETLVPENLTIDNVVQGVFYTKNVYVMDVDFLVPEGFADEELAFEVHSPSSSITNVQIQKLPGYDDRAILTFDPISSGLGFLTVNVSDKEGLYVTENVTFNILESTTDPVITHISPYLLASNLDFGFTSSFSNPTTFDLTVNVDVDFEDNCTRAIVSTIPQDINFSFDALAINDSSVLDNHLNYRWYVDSVLVSNLQEVTPGVDSAFNFNQNINQSRQVNVTLVVEDSRFSSTSHTWMVDFVVNNRPPSLCSGSLEDLEVNGTTAYPDYLSFRFNKQRFYVPQEDLNMDGIRNDFQNEPTSVSYSVQNPSSCGLIEFSFQGDQITLRPLNTGMCVVRFVATNDYGEAISDEVTINAIEAVDTPDPEPTPSPTSTPEPLPIPFLEEIDVPKPLRIVFPGDASIFENKTIEIPILIENTYVENIRGVRLSADMPGHDNITYSFSNNFFNDFGVGETIQETLTITNYREELSPYEIRVQVDVQEPEFSDTAAILLAGLEQTGVGDDVQVRVTFARDMLSSVPECMELNDYIDDVQFMIQRGDVSEASTLLEIVINACNDLRDEQNFRIENPGLVSRFSSFSSQHSLDIMNWAAAASLIVIMGFLAVGIKRRLV